MCRRGYEVSWRHCGRHLYSHFMRVARRADRSRSETEDARRRRLKSVVRQKKLSISVEFDSRTTPPQTRLRPLGLSGHFHLGTPPSARSDSSRWWVSGSARPRNSGTPARPRSRSSSFDRSVISDPHSFVRRLLFTFTFTFL